jgi:hypothetical protein
MSIIVHGEPKTAEELIEQQKNIALVSNLARFLGKRNKKRLVYTWRYEGLFIVVNDDKRFTIAMYNHEVVCSNLIPPPIFVTGSWWEIVLKLQEQIRQAKAASQAKNQRECLIGPLVEVG